VLAARRCRPRLGLVRVQAVDSLRGQCLAHARVELVGQRSGPRVACRLGAEVGELLALQEIGGDAHFRA
jgi:hypothetical protein